MFNKITVELDFLGVKIEEEDKAPLLLALLPSSFNNVMTILIWKRLDEVIVALLMNETRRGNNGFSDDGQVAMVTKESSQR